MVAVVRINSFGGPEQLVYEQMELPAPGAGEVHIRQHAVGLNYTDVYSRVGRPGMKAPLVLGAEASGDVVAVGSGVSEFKPGDRVAYTGGLGAYAEERLYPADRLVEDSRRDVIRNRSRHHAQGADRLVSCAQDLRGRPGSVVLLHAAAGGVGLILAQWAAHLGATVIGTVGSADKAKLAQANGCNTRSCIATKISPRASRRSRRASSVTSSTTASARRPFLARSIACGRAECSSPLVTLRARSRISISMRSGRRADCSLPEPMLPWYVQTREELLEGVGELFEQWQKGGEHRHQPSLRRCVTSRRRTATSRRRQDPRLRSADSVAAQLRAPFKCRRSISTSGRSRVWRRLPS